MNKSFIVIGGDVRQGYLADFLAEKGEQVSVFALDRYCFTQNVEKVSDLALGLKKADYVILPMPLLADEKNINAPLAAAPHTLEKVLQLVPQKARVLGGSVSPAATALAKSLGTHITDYLQREELAILNAIPTAEGAINIALEELPFILHGSRVLVLGGGRIASILAQKLAALGARVTVSARKQADFAKIIAAGHNFVHTDALESVMDGFDLIYNTIPSRILTRNLLALLPNQTLVVDLASKPGGVDFEAAAALGKRAIWALSLPGKVAPLSSAQFILTTIYNILEEDSYA